MREIKFRGYSKYNKKWYYGFLSRPHNDSSIYTIYDEMTTHYPINVEEVSIGQYTGLKDKNGVDIYEGDILYDKFGFSQIVVYDESLGEWVTREMQTEFKMNDLYVIHDVAKVIGNIYEEKIKESR